MPLVPETKMADEGKLISLGDVLARKVTWFVLTTTSPTSILSRDFGAVCMTKIAYIYSRLSRTHTFPFHFDSQGQPGLLYCDLQRQLILSILTQRDNILSLSYILTSSSEPHEMSATIFFLVLPLRLDLLQPRKQTLKTCQTTERNKHPIWEKTHSS